MTTTTDALKARRHRVAQMETKLTAVTDIVRGLELDIRLQGNDPRMRNSMLMARITVKRQLADQLRTALGMPMSPRDLDE